MKNLALLLLMLSACTNKPVDLSSKAAHEISNADIAMSDLASKEGFHKSLLQFADDNLIKPQEGELPVIGKTALEKYWSAKPETKNLTWIPFKTEASASGDLGYTIGNWKFVSEDTTLYGNYYTIWKKQGDGQWKFVVDGGNSTPAPEK